MKQTMLHSWNVTPAEALQIQKELSRRVVIEGGPGNISVIAGVDCAFSRDDNTGYCAIILFSFPDLTIIEEQYHHGDIPFPYVPGLLSFREGPLILETYKKLTRKPDCIIFDGQGIAHPRRFGIAAHMGLWLDVPAIGCAKSRLYGSHDGPGSTSGSSSPLSDKNGEQIGIVFRTRDNVKPVYISPGHRVGFESAQIIISRCTGKYRIPVPTRIADIKVGEYKRSLISNID